MKTSPYAINTGKTFGRFLIATVVLQVLALAAGQLIVPLLPHEPAGLAETTTAPLQAPFAALAVTLLALTATTLVGRTWPERGLWLAPCALSTLAAGCLMAFSVALRGTQNDKTLIGLVLGIPLLAVALLLAGAIVGLTHLSRRRRGQTPPMPPAGH